MWRRHCNALLRKQVLPLLKRPVPRLKLGGHERSMGAECKDVLLAAVERAGAGAVLVGTGVA